MSGTLGTHSLPVAREFLERILRPYKPHCRYVRGARIEHPDPAAKADGDGGATGEDAPYLCRIQAELAIPESCYIDDTGHLNTVEVNICYNQMLYLLLAQGIVHKLIPALDSMDLAHFERRYLPDVLIHRIEGSFKRVIDRRGFQGEMRFTRATRTKKFVHLESSSRFWDAANGLATFDVTVAFLLNA